MCLIALLPIGSKMLKKEAPEVTGEGVLKLGPLK